MKECIFARCKKTGRIIALAFLQASASLIIVGCSDISPKEIDVSAVEQHSEVEVTNMESSTEEGETVVDSKFVAGYKVEKNESNDKANFPYVIHTESSNWYIAEDDIELLGEDDFWAGLEEVLQLQESDFADAREILKDYLDEVPAVDIYTDFCGKAGSSTSYLGAYYNKISNFIKVFHAWGEVENSLLHEYVHYLTMTCTKINTQDAMFCEGVAEYVSKIACKNLMARRSFYNAMAKDNPEYVDQLKTQGMWDTDDDEIDIAKLYYFNAKCYADGTFNGGEYTTITMSKMTRTDQKLSSMQPVYLSYIEAGCIFEYLVDTYSFDMVMEHLDTKNENFEEVFGKKFYELYDDWKKWNEDKCDSFLAK